MADLIKNIEQSKIFTLVDLVQYEEGKVISLSLAGTDGVKMTLFAIAKGEGIGGHAAPGDAMVVILDGKASITLNGRLYMLSAGETLVMPKNSPHSLKAEENFKMLLTVVK